MPDETGLRRLPAFGLTTKIRRPDRAVLATLTSTRQTRSVAVIRILHASHN